jgi:hypothetical protein
VVEEARLESVYTGNRIEGSNPSVSASARRSFSEGGLFCAGLVNEFSLPNIFLSRRTTIGWFRWIALWTGFIIAGSYQ